MVYWVSQAEIQGSRQGNTVEPTISNDRTRGSSYDINNERLVALAESRQPPTPEDFAPAPQRRPTVVTSLPPTSAISTATAARSVGPRSRNHSPRKPSTYVSTPRSLNLIENSSEMQSLQDACDHHEEVDDERLLGGSARDISSLANYLGIPEQSASSLETIQAYISQLQREQNHPRPSREPRPLTIHRVFDLKGSTRIYLDNPQWQDGESESRQVLVGALPISNVEAYLSRHPEVCFIACRDYETSPTFDVFKEDQDGSTKVSHHREHIVPIEMHLASAIRRFAAFNNEPDRPAPTRTDPRYHRNESDGSDDEYYQEFRNDWLDGHHGITLSSPYLQFYHARDQLIHTFISSLDVHQRSQFQRVADYVTATLGDEYAHVDSLIAESKITNRYLSYLVKPGIVLVQGQGENARGFMCSSWLQTPHQVSKKAEEPKDQSLPVWMSQKTKVEGHTVMAWHWDFNRRLAKAPTELKMERIAINDHTERKISDMELRPLSHVDSETLGILQNRGEWFWKCRQARMIAYHEGPGNNPTRNLTSERYMIDMATYNELHPEQFPTAVSYAWSSSRPFRNDAGPMDSEDMSKEDPPDASFIYLAPTSMRGFNLKTKKWRDLSIDKFAEVEWNNDAFKSLVLNGSTKRLIQALISNQIEAEMSTDIISGKGNGLIMLLHGGPGTGKTLTAESVAEIAQRPLYPVTCGDIGTEPRAVETYLESVLHLGRTWGCVVLLDEADVFLEQRSLEDLHRNALVSVFLRVLEYYDGILVLTSNRVGTFDEAFKSRIQLAIHYTSLSLLQRIKIWGNFFTRLKNMTEDGIDFLDLEDHIEDLARHKMNGREIRNVITTARQFARWERKQAGGSSFLLNYKVMEEIIETSGKFDRYIEKLNGGMSQDQLAEDEGLRLASSGP